MNFIMDFLNSLMNYVIWFAEKLIRKIGVEIYFESTPIEKMLFILLYYVGIVSLVLFVASFIKWRLKKTIVSILYVFLTITGIYFVVVI